MAALPSDPTNKGLLLLVVIFYTIGVADHLLGFIDKMVTLVAKLKLLMVVLTGG